MSYDNTNTGTLGKNKRKEKENHPSHTGKLNVEGKEYWISAWVKEGRDGKFFSLAIKPKDGAPTSRTQDSPNTAQQTQQSFEDDDIPF